MRTKKQNALPKQARNRILSVTVKRTLDDSPDTSYLEQEGFEERLASYLNGDFGFIGIRAEAEIGIPQGQGCLLTQKLSSGGLRGIESDSDKDYLKEIEDEQLSELRDVLRSMGFLTCSISAAFKNIKEEGN